jgi:hypothetical protein
VKLLRRNRPTIHDGILEHYRAFWGADRIEEIHWTPGPLASRLPDLHIVKVPPSADGDIWTFATIGVWRATEDEKRGIEFVAVSRAHSAAVMERLGMVAYYQAGGTTNRLGAGHLLPIGEPWVPGSLLDAILISLPYPWGPAFEHCQLRDRHVQILWVLPITSAERTYAREHGVDALEERFEEAHVDYLDTTRKSVA